jgi:cytochrome bd-type quinol oxidase subunit 2
MFGGAVILSGVICLDCWASQQLGEAANRFRSVLGVAASLSLTFLAVAVTAQAERNRVAYASEFVMFLCLPVLLVCAPLLWISAKAIRSTLRRLLMLAVFVTATALAELHSFNHDSRNLEEQLFSSHSLLIALALAIWLGSWGNQQFRQR